MKSKNTMKLESGIVGVPFGRTGVSIGADDVPFRELSHGHGHRGACFHGSFKSLNFQDFSFSSV